MGKGKRYNGERKLNIKKVFAVIIAIVVIIMFIIILNKLLTKDKNEKITSESYFVIYENNKYGVINSKGQKIIEPSYAELIVIPNYKKDIFICTYDIDGENYKTKALNSKNEQVFKDYEEIGFLDNYDAQNNISYEQNLLKVKKNGKYGLIDFNGKEKLSCEYDNIETLKGAENSIIVTKDGKKGIIDSEGKNVITANYNNIKLAGKDYKLGYIVQDESSQYGLVDIANNKILENKYQDIKSITENNLYAVKQNDKWKVIDKQENIIIENLDDIKSIKNGNIIIKKGSLYGVTNKESVETIPVEYEDITEAFTDTYIVKKDNKYGLINDKNEVIKEIKYTSFKYYSQPDFAEASIDGINSEIFGNDYALKITGIVSEINTEKEYMRIRVSDEYRYYNFKFEEKNVTDIFPQNTLFLKKQNGKYGYVNKEGNEVVSYIYDDATEQNACGYVAVKKDGKWGSLDKNGNIVIEPTYNLDDNVKIDFIGEWHIGKDPNMNCYTK